MTPPVHDDLAAMTRVVHQMIHAAWPEVSCQPGHAQTFHRHAAYLLAQGVREAAPTPAIDREWLRGFLEPAAWMLHHTNKHWTHESNHTVNQTDIRVCGHVDCKATVKALAALDASQAPREETTP